MKIHNTPETTIGYGIDPEKIGLQVSKILGIRNFIDNQFDFLPDLQYSGYGVYKIAQENPLRPELNKHFKTTKRVAIDAMIPGGIRAEPKEYSSPESWLNISGHTAGKHEIKARDAGDAQLQDVVMRYAGRMCMLDLKFLDDSGVLTDASVQALAYLRGDISQSLDRGVWNYADFIEEVAHESKDAIGRAEIEYLQQM